MDRLRAIWARWRQARAQRKLQPEEGQVGKTEYTESASPQDLHYRRGGDGGMPPWGGAL